MSRRVPRSAFAFFVALGERRSYHTVAEELGVATAIVERVAALERWHARVEAIDSYAGQYLRGERGQLARYGPEYEWIDELWRQAMICLRRYPTLTSFELVDQREREMHADRKRGESLLSKDQILDYTDQLRGAVLADRQRNGTPELGESVLL